MGTTRAAQPATTGLDLKIERIRAGVSQTTIARRLGVTRHRIGYIEGRLRPTDRAIAEFRAALAEAVDAGEIGNRA